jgi:very-short-patch-repair endonuclease
MKQLKSTKTCFSDEKENSFQNHFLVNENQDFQYRKSINYFRLPFNPTLKEVAKKLRKSNNLSETLFWNRVKRKQFNNFDFDRQKIIGDYIVDFYCSNCDVIIEIDGNSHNGKEDYDFLRDQFFIELGLKIIHIDSMSVLQDMDAVMDYLRDHPYFQI